MRSIPLFPEPVTAVMSTGVQRESTRFDSGPQCFFVPASKAASLTSREKLFIASLASSQSTTAKSE